jgi:hypothetical protein
MTESDNRLRSAIIDRSPANIPGTKMTDGLADNARDDGDDDAAAGQ